MKMIRRRFDCRGTSVLELVLVLPALFMVIFAGIELSRAWFTMNLVTQAAREGARVRSVSSDAAARDRMNQVLGSGGLTASAGYPNTTCSGTCVPDSTVMAAVAVAFTPSLPFLSVPGFGTITITQTAVMRRE